MRQDTLPRCTVQSQSALLPPPPPPYRTIRNLSLNLIPINLIHNPN
jgi:hypothetical protein